MYESGTPKVLKTLVTAALLPVILAIGIWNSFVNLADWVVDTTVEVWWWL